MGRGGRGGERAGGGRVGMITILLNLFYSSVCFLECIVIVAIKIGFIREIMITS